MIQKNDWFRGDETGCDWFCKHSVWISKRTLGRTPIPRIQNENGKEGYAMLRDGVMIMIALMCGGCFGVVVTCCMVTAKRSDQELGDMMKEKREGTVMQCENETM